MESVHITAQLTVPASKVYDFVSNPENLALWAQGATGSVTFAPHNEFGVLDHTVSLADGGSVYVPFRVLPLEDGSELVFTIRRSDGMSDADFERDRESVESDLLTLTGILEGGTVEDD
jgi:uncharacterized protein YndB with AHSA1/START domain